MAVSRSVAALCGAAGVAVLSLSGAAQAADKFSWSASATGTSDYVFRGVSQTDNDPAIQGSLDATYGMFYTGVWGSKIDWTGISNTEVDWYAGVTPSWGPATFDFGVIYYGYPRANSNDYWEFKAGVSGEIVPKLSAGATFYYSPDIVSDEWYVYEGTLSYELPKVGVVTPSVSGLVGYTDWDATNGDYTYWNAGLALAVDNLTFDFRYWDTDLSAATCAGVYTGANTCDERFVFSTTLSLP
jgi:uncharacterized protein (TIGR02001 family)